MSIFYVTQQFIRLAFGSFGICYKCKTFLKTKRTIGPIFAVMIGTGMRVGEEIIDVNHTLVYYNHAQNGCYFNVHTPKTKAGNRKIPILDYVKEAFLEEKNIRTLIILDV